jgi:signal peptidase I
VDEGCLFVLGDNRNESKDSRSTDIGLIDRREILGKAVFVLFPGKVSEQSSRELGRIGVVS